MWLSRGETPDITLYGNGSLWMCEQHETTILELNVYSEEICIWSKRQCFILEWPAAWLTYNGLSSFVSYGAKIWKLLPVPYKMGVSFDTLKSLIKTWSGPTCKCTAICIQLFFPIIAMYNNLKNVKKLVYGLRWSIVHDYDFCFLHLSENSLHFLMANVVCSCVKPARNEVYLILMKWPWEIWVKSTGIKLKQTYNTM